MTTATARKKKARPKTLKLDLACGQNKQKGFVGVDIMDIEGVDIVHDLTQYPWPFEDGSVREVFCSHYVEHTPLDVNGEDGLIAFMNELHRVCRKGAKVEIIHPFFKSERAFQDPTHRRFITATTWNYFDAAWRELAKLDHYPITTDFEVSAIGWAWADAEIPKRSQEYQQRAATRDWDVVSDLCVRLKKR